MSLHSLAKCTDVSEEEPCRDVLQGLRCCPSCPNGNGATQHALRFLCCTRRTEKKARQDRSS